MTERAPVFIQASGTRKQIQTGDTLKGILDLRTITSGETLTDVENEFILCDSDGGAFTVTMIDTHSSGRIKVLVNTGTSDNDITIDPGTKLISGSAADRILHDGMGVILVGDSTNWTIINVFGKDTIESRGINVETITASKTLTDNDASFQVFNPSTETENVNLPAPTSQSPVFTILNASTANHNLYILDHDGYVAACLAPNEIERFTTDGTCWINARGRVLGQTLLPYGCNNAPFLGMRPNGQNLDASASNARTSPVGAFSAPYDGRVVAGGMSSQFDHHFPMTVFVEGEEKGGINLEGAGQIQSSIYRSNLGGVQFKLGDALAFDPGRYGSTTSRVASQILIEPTSGTTKYGAGFGWGADIATSGHYARANGISSATSSASAGFTNHPMPIAGNVIGIAWNVTTSGGVMRLDKNSGAATDDFTLTDTTGFIAITESFTAGSYFAIKHQSGTVPGAGVYLLITDIPGVVYSFGGDSAASLSYLSVHGEYDEATAATLDFTTTINIIYPGKLKAIAVSRIGAAGEIGLYKNDSTVNIIDGTTSGSTIFTINPIDSQTSFNRTVDIGDRFSVGQDSGTAWGDSVINLYVGPD